jgi:hypothetical protein
MLPFVFGSGAALSAGAAAVVFTPPQHAAPARRLALASAALELGLNEVMRRRLGEHAEPYKRGAPSKLRLLSGAAVMSGAALLARRGAGSRTAAIAAGSLLSAGAACARWTVFRAGFVSASDPKYVVGPQRRMIERRQRNGAARRTANVTEVQPALGSPATAPAVQRDIKTLSPR